MLRYVRCHYRRAVLFSAIVLGIAALTAGALTPVSSEDVQREDRAAQAIADAEALLDTDDPVGAGLALIAAIDMYPDTEAKLGAYGLLKELRSQVSGGQVPPEKLVEFETHLPAVADLATHEAKNILYLFHLTKVNLMGKMGLKDMAKGVLESTGTGILDALDAYPDSPWHVSMLPVLFESASKCSPEYAGKFAQGLEAYIAETRPCLGTFSARFALVTYYLHEGMDRKAAERHLPLMTDTAAKGLVATALADPYLSQDEKACMLWAVGYALFESGKNGEALAVFEQVSREYPGAAREKEWAEINIPATLKRLHPNDPTIAEAAYQDYLAAHADHEYAQWALIELGNIALETNQPDKASAYYRQIVTQFPDGHAVAMASSGIEKATELKSAPVAGTVN